MFNLSLFEYQKFQEDQARKSFILNQCQDVILPLIQNLMNEVASSKNNQIRQYLIYNFKMIFISVPKSFKNNYANRYNFDLY